MRTSKEEKSRLGIIDYASTKVTIGFRLDNRIEHCEQSSHAGAVDNEISICIYTYEGHLEVVI